MWRCACALLLLGAALAHADAEKRAEMSPVPFVLGSRYGRSPPRLIAPRNDRFFMGSRYGKRSEPPLSALLNGSGSGGQAAAGATGPTALLCEFTGLYPLYRCTVPSRHVLYNTRRNEDDSGVGDEE